MKLEVCANSFQSALAARRGGAHRIELCQELALGGITPSYGLLKKTLDTLDIPVFVLVRPRSGDFTYSEDEFDVMLRDIDQAKKMGAQGIVSGVLCADFTLDEKRTQQLLEASQGMQFTFHRAFDWVRDPFETIEKLVALGVDRVLSSGQSANAVKGIHLLAQLQKTFGKRIGLLPGGGINVDNVLQFKAAGFKEVHASLSMLKKSIVGPVPMQNLHPLMEHSLSYADVKKIERLIALL